SGLIREALAEGDARRGAAVFAAAKSACLSCHKVGDQGGAVGPELTAAGACLKPEEIVEAILWPKKKVKEGYEAVTVATADGKVRQGYRKEETDRILALADPATGDRVEIPRAEIEAVRGDGTLMPDGLLAAMTPAERRDLVRFLIDLGRPGGINAGEMVRHS